MKQRKIQITHLPGPHWKALVVAFVAVIGESVTDLLEPWPLKIILDYVLSSKRMPGWMADFINPVLGQDKLAILSFAAIAVIAIALGGAISNLEETVDDLEAAYHSWREAIAE